jgi:hypothetical protein
MITMIASALILAIPLERAYWCPNEDSIIAAVDSHCPLCGSPFIWPVAKWTKQR